MRKEVLLAHFPKISVSRYRRLLTHFGSLEEAWRAGAGAWRDAPWDSALREEFFLWKERIDEAAIERTLQAEEIGCLTSNDSGYPPLLKKIYDPPFCLFVRGGLAPLINPLAVVGTRSSTPYGRQVATELVTALAARGVTIVSGLALGIDGVAHEAALAAGGKTVAVLGTGINRSNVYPSAHRSLAERIVKNGGAMVSEYPPGTEPTGYSFPRRNRIIAGMSLGTVVIEAGETSGALITAECSADGGRDVFAVPQNITSPTAAGVNRLLKQGAHPVTSADDILDILRISTLQTIVKEQRSPTDDPATAGIRQYLSRTPIHINDLTKQTGLPSAVVNSTMAIMELEGQARHIGGMRYVAA
ncbi:MAG: DNA-protecting protein DprA [Candidatus Magasanikbacteria bacterium]|nr:DNA-protecting protein DprA [Candidatus Magasanikbacteria bacterium]